MKYRVVLRPQAEIDIAEARNWYESRRGGLGKRFLDRVQAVRWAVGEHPAQYPVVYRNVRRALVQGFPYGVFYVIRGDRVQVVACFHAKRDPNLLSHRLR